MDIKTFLAEKVMKWKTDIDTDKWITENGLISKQSWYPTHDISDAWSILEMFEEGLIRKRLDGLNYRAWVIYKGKEYSEFGYSPCVAICNVALKAYGRSEIIK